MDDLAPVVGVDVGENSVGLASIVVDDSGMPNRIHRLLVVLHDNGKDGMASGQAATVSRKASGGAARRVRRLFRNRRKRVLRLSAELARLGYPVVDQETLHTYDAWLARSNLLAGRIADDAERARKLSVAIRHMANHRGWVNSWVPLKTYLWKEEPSPEFEQAVDRVLEQHRFNDVAREDLCYQADIALLGLGPTERLRPRNPASSSPDAVHTPHLLGLQRRVDVIREWRQICRVQGLPDEVFQALAEVAFAQQMPYVPITNVGTDWLPGFTDKHRASVASLEHQEFQIRQTVANLGIRDRPRSKHAPRKLTIEERVKVADALMCVGSRDEAPTWRQVAEDLLGIDPLLLVVPDSERSVSSLAPVLNSATVVLSLPLRHPIRQWWNSASTTVQDRSDFIAWFTDSARIEREAILDERFGQLLEELDDRQSEKLQALRFRSGRSAHCREALRQLNADLASSAATYVEVRNSLLGTGTNSGPRLDTLDTGADHPTLQRVLPIVRRFLLGVEREVGRPKSVVIEHVRGAFLGFAAKQEAAKRQAANRRDREQAQQDIADAGLGADNASGGVIRRFQAVRRQGCKCLYCGSTIQFRSAELDHIVPRASGGSSVRANLVAVCRDCNSSKNKIPFAQFASSGRLPGVSLDGAIRRVDEMDQGRLKLQVFRRLKAEMKARLRQTEEDDPIDERALASTAYAAVDIRQRINTTFGDNEVTKVYSGRIVSMARHASGIDKRIPVRAAFDVKSRFDRRHHAIDAAVAAMLNPSVARTLAERDDLRRAANDTGRANEWEKFEGSSPAAIERFRSWKVAMKQLATLVEAELVADKVVVTHPIRLSARHGALHKDGRKGHATKRVGDAWSPEERARIVDDRVYASLTGDLTPAAHLGADDERSVELPSGVRLPADGLIYLFPDTAARVALPNRSSAELGQSVHQARLYRWDDRRGRRKAGIVRLFASDLYDLEGGIRGNLLTAELSANSRAARRSSLTLREALADGKAVHVGTFVIGDEILIDPSEWPSDNEPGRFLREFPERHWRLAGFMSDTQFTLTSLLLSQEGLADPAGEIDRRKVAVSDLARKVISDRMKVTSSALWEKPSTRVIRRTATGAIRESGASGLPASWSPNAAVYKD